MVDTFDHGFFVVNMVKTKAFLLRASEGQPLCKIYVTDKVFDENKLIWLLSYDIIFIIHKLLKHLSKHRDALLLNN